MIILPIFISCKRVMKSIVFVLFAVAISSSIQQDFAAFEVRFGKNYLSSERAFRAKVFEYNMAWAAKVNAENHPYKVGPTPFADMTNTEFATSKMCGCMLRPANMKPAKQLEGEPAETIDWREKGAVTPVKNQASCGSCWAFSATGALEGGNFVATGKLVSASEQQLVDCDKKSNGCGGGLMTNAFEYVMEKGLCSEEDYPYHAKEEDCKDNQCTPVLKNKGYENVPPMIGLALRLALNKAPVSVAVEADSPVFQMYKSGILDSSACGDKLNHGVLAVGYVDRYAEHYFIVKNSWGDDWGEDGYIRIWNDEHGSGICGINLMNSYPTF